MQTIEQIAKQYGFPVLRPMEGMSSAETNTPLVAKSRQPVCTRCDDKGFVMPKAEPGQHGFGRAVPCGCKQQQRAHRYLEHSGLMPDEYGLTIEHEPTLLRFPDAINTVRKLLAADKPVGIFGFYGPYGTGKSGLLKATVAHFCKSGLEACYTTAAAILENVKLAFDKNNALSVEGQIATWAKIPVLAIDELEKSSDNDWSKHTLFQIIDLRHRQRRRVATLVATNREIGLDRHGKPTAFGKLLHDQHGNVLGEDPLGYLGDRLQDGQNFIMDGDSQRGEGYWYLD